jgi:hypothetical protein
MSKLKIILLTLLMLILALCFLIYCKEDFSDHDCVDVKYNSYRTLHFESISETKLMNDSEYEFRESNEFLYNLYVELSMEKKEGQKGKPIDFRVAFKACGQKRWIFYSLNSFLKLDGLVYKLERDKVDLFIMNMDFWEEGFNK